ncbi:MAG: hypothetical protein HYX69_15540 [Planctomycetia bacterium]|nr:hypothetical protein [Planctomycetia bacterium]
MNGSAHVKSIDALTRFRAALCVFGDEAGQALSSIRVELDRFQDWLKHDQLAHWQHEIRVREDKLAEAKTDLHRCLAATIDPNRTPSCYQEKKVLERAKHRLEEAREKLAAVRRWIPIVERAVFEYRMKAEPLDNMLAVDLARGLAQLDRSSEQLWAYVNLAVPERVGAAESAISATAIAQSPGEAVESGKPGSAKPPAASVPAPADARKQEVAP